MSIISIIPHKININQQTRGRFHQVVIPHGLQFINLPPDRLWRGMGRSSTKASVENCPILRQSQDSATNPQAT